MRDYVVIIEKTPTGYSAYSPDVDGCVAGGKSRRVVERRMRAALTDHLALLREQGDPVPKPESFAISVTVTA